MLCWGPSNNRDKANVFKTAVALYRFINWAPHEVITICELVKETIVNPIYQPLHSGRIWHKVNF